MDATTYDSYVLFDRTPEEIVAVADLLVSYPQGGLTKGVGVTVEAWKKTWKVFFQPQRLLQLRFLKSYEENGWVEAKLTQSRTA